jgi:antitoxin HicB
MPACFKYAFQVSTGLSMAKEAIELYIESLAARGKDIPLEEEERIETTITVKANAKNYPSYLQRSLPEPGKESGWPPF